MVKRTTINLDMELVAQARGALSAKNTTDTVHAALREVVRRERLRRLAEWDLGGLTLEDLKEMRRPRTETRKWGKLGTGYEVLRTAQNAKKARSADKTKPTSGAPTVKHRHAATG